MSGMISKFRKTKVGQLIWPIIRLVNEPSRVKKGMPHVEQAIIQSEKYSKRIFYCGICETSNMGDIAQTYCALNWLQQNYPDYGIVLCKTSVLMEPRCNFIKKLKEIAKKEDIVVFQSGYNTHDIDGYEDLMHQKVIKAFPNNEVLMLPQTVYFISDERKKKCSEVYNAHKRMLFLARDHKSEIIAQEMFPDLTVKLFPDIVTSLVGYTENIGNKRNGIYLCRRHDVEQYYVDEDYKSFEKALSKFDKVTISDTVITASNSEIFSNLKKYMDDIIDYFGSFRLVVTDKFHGLVFSLVSNTPVIVLRTKDHKVTSGYEWFSKIYPETVYFADNIDQIKEISNRILTSYEYGILDNYFDREYYQKLRIYIEEWENNGVK